MVCSDTQHLASCSGPSSWLVYLVGQYVEYSVQDSESFHISQRHRLNLKLLLQSVKVKANVSGSCPDTHLNSNIHSIYFSLNSWAARGWITNGFWISNNNLNFNLSLYQCEIVP